MAEINYSPPRGNRVQEVSRQFTGAERMMDDRMTAHITQELPSLQVGVGSRTAYGWLEEDLKRRSLVTSVLNQERQIAEAQGVRQEMDRLFTQDTEDEAEAIAAQKQINAMLASDKNMRRQDAVLAVTKDRPDYWGNKFFTEIEDQNKGLYETEMERKKREGDLATSVIKNEFDSLTGTAKLEALQSPLGQEYLKNSNKFLIEKEMRQLPLDEKEQELKMEIAKNDLRQQKMLSETLDFTDQTFVGKSKAAVFLRERGLPIKDVGRAGSFLQSRPEVIQAIAHPTFLASNPQADASLRSAMEVIQNPNAKPEEIAEAESELAYVAGAHANFVGKAAISLQNEERAMKYGSERGESLADLNEKVLSITTKNTEGKRTSSVPVEAEILNTYEGWIKAQISADNRLAPLWDKYQERINAVRGKGDPQTVINEARFAAGDFSMEASQLSSPTKEVTKPAAKGSTSSAPASPNTRPKTRVNPKDGREYILNEKDGKYYLPR